MAIFSLNHSFIGRSTHAAGSASLFARYATGQDRTDALKLSASACPTTGPAL
jgi:hypothetical protein